MSTNVNRGLAWIGMASSLIGVLDIVAILIILNNWVSSAEYGIATKAIWIFPVLDQATDLGLSAAVVQRDDHTPRRISTVFYINVFLSLVLVGIIAIVAPIVAVHFYGHAIVGWMLIAYSSKLVLQNGYFIPTAMMKRELRYKEMSILRIVGNLLEFTAKVGFAWAGFGIWCFVLGPLVRTVVYLVGTQMRQPYWPTWEFSYAEAKDYVKFGLRSSGSQILFHFYTNVDYPIVGYFFGDVSLGIYRVAYEIVLEPVRIISYIVVDIAFPAFAKIRANRDALIAQLVSFTRLNLITVMTYSAVVLVAAPDVIHLLFPSYSGSTEAVRILCVVAVLRALGFVMPPLLDGVGHPERTLRYQTLAAVMMPIAYIVGANTLGARLGFESVAVAWAVGYPIAFLFLVFVTTLTLRWSVVSYLRAVGGVAACMLGAAALAAIVYPFLPHEAFIRFAITVAIVVVGSGLLLAYTQGLTLRSAYRSMREPPPPSQGAGT